MEAEVFHYESICGGYTPHAETDGDVIYNLEATTCAADTTDWHNTGHGLANYNCNCRSERGYENLILNSEERLKRGSKYTDKS